MNRNIIANNFIFAHAIYPLAWLFDTPFTGNDKNMIGAIEILIIAVIFGIIYGRDAIDKTFRKSANEGVVESMAGDLKDYYEEDPKRMIKLGIFIVSIILFFGLGIYWALTRTDFLKMIGLDQ